MVYFAQGGFWEMFIKSLLESNYMQVFDKKDQIPYSSKELKEIMTTLVPGRWEACQRGYNKEREEDKLPSKELELLSRVKVLDMVYALDILVNPKNESEFKNVYGFDVTLDYSKVESKLAKCRTLKPAYDYIEVEKVFVVHVSPNEVDSGVIYKARPKEWQEKVADLFFEQYYDLIEKEGWLHSISLSLPADNS